MTPERIQSFLIFFPILIISIALHEFAHCWMTDRLGDDTPRREGRITLNPLAHLDLMGTIMIVVSSLSGFGFGWGKSSPFNPSNFRNPARDRMLTAIAGPISNILQSIAWASLMLLLVPFTAQNWFNDAFIFCYIGVKINITLAIFNLLPVYPLDGHHILSWLAPPSWRPVIDNPIWGFVFLFIVFSHFADGIIYPVMDYAGNAVIFSVLGKSVLAFLFGHS